MSFLVLYAYISPYKIHIFIIYKLDHLNINIVFCRLIIPFRFRETQILFYVLPFPIYIFEYFFFNLIHPAQPCMTFQPRYTLIFSLWESSRRISVILFMKPVHQCESFLRKVLKCMTYKTRFLFLPKYPEHISIYL